jgi:D-alanyl-D-alanine carboxypeptidase
VFDRGETRITSLLATFVVVFVFGTLAATGQASARDAGARKVSEPGVAARAWAMMDLRSGEYLAGDDASEELPIASTTKIMAALVVLDGADPEEEVTVSEDAAAYATPAYSNVGLLPGDALSVRELLMAALISSGDDAAYALAEHVGGGGEAGVNDFVTRMNEKARALGLEHTHFENPVGFDESGHYSSAQDLATLAQAAMLNPKFREMVSTPYATIHTRQGDSTLKHQPTTLHVRACHRDQNGHDPWCGRVASFLCSQGRRVVRLCDPRFARGTFRSLGKGAALRIRRLRPHGPRRGGQTLCHRRRTLPA